MVNNGWDDLAPERESDGILFIRVLIAELRYEDALHSITALLVAAEQGLRQSITIELLILQALTRQAQNQIRQAIVAIERALRLAKPERYVRIFLDEGLAMIPLLKQAGQGSEGEYANYLLTLIDSDNSNAKNSNRLIEPMSAKELKVLELLITGLSNREIADHVYVSINTVKSHLKNIYRKLDVTNRVEAASKGTHILQFL
ncbi:MAG: LuxR C-terminal-related transcriptional regulator [Thiohalomonadales bacterium]